MTFDPTTSKNVSDSENDHDALNASDDPAALDRKSVRAGLGGILYRLLARMEAEKLSAPIVNVMPEFEEALRNLRYASPDKKPVPRLRLVRQS